MTQVDFDRMAAEEGLSVAAIKAALGVEPSNTAEAREHFYFIVQNDAANERKVTTALKAWLQFVSTAVEAKVLKVDPQNRRLSLGIKQVNDIWAVYAVVVNENWTNVPGTRMSEPSSFE